MDAQKFSYSRTKIVFLSIAAIFLLTLPGFFYFFGEKWKGVNDRYYMGVTAIFFLLLLILILKRLASFYFDINPVVSISDFGICVRQVSNDVICWEKITSIEESNGKGGRYFSLRLLQGVKQELHLKNPDSYSIYIDSIDFSPTLLEGDAKKILHAIRNRFEQAKLRR
ncbi:hypothetical protein M2322_000757 [Rhodoblastus acidophilus]|uniref:hypothetical protein n=1 Tax=Rhodoblastus acidophilus TaxID=1074 RepID=UPI002225183D|nr:hypothetical protein [Rhodoblastus acidophilus]MCW2315223.1 hypothetical protein [Rhodoblastus acidophilus]